MNWRIALAAEKSERSNVLQCTAEKPESWNWKLTDAKFEQSSRRVPEVPEEVVVAEV